MLAKPKFLLYEAVNESGVKVKGEFFGTVNDLVRYLRKKKLILVSFEEKVKVKNRNNKYSLEQFLIDLQNLIFLLKAGVTLDEAIVTIISSSNSMQKREFWESVLKDLKSGSLFSLALENAVYRQFDGKIASNISLMKASESIGELTEGIENFLQLMQSILSTKRKIKDSLAYPIFLLSTTYFILGLIFIVVIPRFSSVFSQGDLKKMSFFSKVILISGKFVQAYERIVLGTFFLIPILTVVFLFLMKDRFLELFFKVPFVRNFLLLRELSVFFSSMSASLRGGLDLIQALKLSISLVQNRYLKKELNSILNRIKEGDTLSSLFSFSLVFPPEVSVVLASAEKSASLPEAFDLLARRYELQFNSKLEKIIKLLEPTIIVLLGFVLSFVVVAIMMAVLSINDIV